MPRKTHDAHPLDRHLAVLHAALPAATAARRDVAKAVRALAEAAWRQGVAEGRSATADDIRARGWAVAVHNDYRLKGVPHTFWLFTKDGRAVKGEGRTDAFALAQVRARIDEIERAEIPAGGKTRPR